MKTIDQQLPLGSFCKGLLIFCGCLLPIGKAAAQTSTTTNVTFSTTQVYQGDTPVGTVTVTANNGSYPDGTASCALLARGHNATYSSSLSNGTASIPIQGAAQLALGSYNVNCTYLGSSAYAQSAAPTTTLQVIALPQARWVPDGSMSVPRGGQTATALPNGQVLLAGGVSSGATLLNTGEVYNSATQSTTATQNNMQVPRQSATGTLLQTGKVLIAGGLYTTGNATPQTENAQYPMSQSQSYSDPNFTPPLSPFQNTPTADLYDPVSNTFTSTGSMSAARCGATATMLTDGSVLIANGAGSVPAEIYQAGSATFTKTGKPNTIRAFGSTATLLQNGKVLIVGGSTYAGCVYNPNGLSASQITASAEIFDPKTGQFSVVGSLNVPRMLHTATLLSSGKVLIVGGTSDYQNGLASAELFDPAANTFSYSQGSLASARGGHTANLLPNGLILFAGGSNPVGLAPNTPGVIASSELYDPSTDSFSPTVSMNVARTLAVATQLSNGGILISGGRSAQTSTPVLSNLEEYDAPMVRGWVNPKYVIVGVSYAPPGSQSSVSYTNSITQGNTTTISDAASTGSSLAVSLSNTIGGQFVIAGGSTSYTLSSTSTYNQGSMGTNSVTLTKSSSFSESPQAVQDPNNPVNHNYDVIYLWLNPLLNFTVDPSHPANVVWNGYGYDPNDENGQEIYPVLVGQLIGTIPIDPSTMRELARTWVQNQTFPAGQGPGLTSQDLLTIAQADPFVQCSYDNQSATFTTCYFPNYNTAGGNFGPPPPSLSVDGRFTQVVSQNGQTVPPFSYGPGLPKETYMDSTTDTTTNTKQSNYSFAQTFGIDVNFSGGASAGFFTDKFKLDTKYTQSFMWTHTQQQALTNTTMATSSVTIASPACTGTNCSTYNGPPQFLLYQDNLYGTFMFYPLH